MPSAGPSIPSPTAAVPATWARPGPAGPLGRPPSTPAAGGRGRTPGTRAPAAAVEGELDPRVVAPVEVGPTVQPSVRQGQVRIGRVLVGPDPRVDEERDRREGEPDERRPEAGHSVQQGAGRDRQEFGERV